MGGMSEGGLVIIERKKVANVCVEFSNDGISYILPNKDIRSLNIIVFSKKHTFRPTENISISVSSYVCRLIRTRII